MLNLNREQLLPIQEKLPEASQLVLNEILEPVIEEPLEEHILELTSSSLEDFWTYISKEQFLEYKEKGISHSDANDICDSGFSIQACYDNTSALFVDGEEIEEFHQIVKEAIAANNQSEASTKNTSTTTSTSKKKKVKYALVVASGGSGCCWHPRRPTGWPSHRRW